MLSAKMHILPFAILETLAQCLKRKKIIFFSPGINYMVYTYIIVTRRD